MRVQSVVSFEDHAAYTDEPRRAILRKLRQFILDLDKRLRDTEKCTLQQRIAYHIPGDGIFLEVKVQRAAIVLHLIDADLDDSEGFATRIPKSHGWKQLAIRIKITDPSEAKKALPFIKAAYKASTKIR